MLVQVKVSFPKYKQMKNKIRAFITKWRVVFSRSVSSHKRQFNYELFDRAVDVVCSCKTPDQREVALKYADRAAIWQYPDEIWEREQYVSDVMVEALRGVFSKTPVKEEG